jgi:hypothetical protein
VPQRAEPHFGIGGMQSLPSVEHCAKPPSRRFRAESARFSPNLHSSERPEQQLRF